MSSSDAEAPKGRKSYLSGDETSPFEAWELPNVGLADGRPQDDLFGFTSRAGRPEPEAEDVMPPTMAELEQIRLEAAQDGFAEGQQQGYLEGLEKGQTEGLGKGFQEGFDQGQQQGFDEGMQRSGEVLSKLESLMDRLQYPLSLLDTEVEMELVKLSMQLAQAVVMTELKTHPEHVLTALRQGVDALPVKQQQVNIRVHAEDAKRITEAYSHSQLEKQGWEIEIDPTLNEGDCLVETQRSRVDLRLSERLTKVLALPNEQLETLHREYQAKQHHAVSPQAVIQTVQDPQPDNPEGSDEPAQEPTAE